MNCYNIIIYYQLLLFNENRSWTWQTCIEYGFFQTDDTSKIFGGKMDLQFYIDICKVAFPIPYGHHRGIYLMIILLIF